MLVNKAHSFLTVVALCIVNQDKQGTVGDVTGDQPWAYQFEARAKWDAWNALKGMDKPTAWKKYIEEATKLLKN